MYVCMHASMHQCMCVFMYVNKCMYFNSCICCATICLLTLVYVDTCEFPAHDRAAVSKEFSARGWELFAAMCNVGVKMKGLSMSTRPLPAIAIH